jgi:hypothetical protein
MRTRLSSDHVDIQCCTRMSTHAHIYRSYIPADGRQHKIAVRRPCQ